MIEFQHDLAGLAGNEYFVVIFDGVNWFDTPPVKAYRLGTRGALWHNHKYDVPRETPPRPLLEAAESLLETVEEDGLLGQLSREERTLLATGAGLKLPLEGFGSAAKRGLVGYNSYQRPQLSLAGRVVRAALRPTLPLISRDIYLIKQKLEQIDDYDPVRRQVIERLCETRESILELPLREWEFRQGRWGTPRDCMVEAALAAIDRAEQGLPSLSTGVCSPEFILRLI